MLCNSTGTMNAGCKTLIDTFGPLILKYLSSGIDPAKVCQIFGLCPTNSSKFILIETLLKNIDL